MIDALRRDLALAARGLSRAPGFTAAVVLTLALGIGGTSTMFTAVDAAFLRPLPYPQADRVVMVWQTWQQHPRVRESMLGALDWEKRSHSVTAMAAHYAWLVNVTSGPEPRRVPSGTVTQGFFAALGVQPRVGRTFSAQEALNNGPRAVILSDRLWRRVFAGDLKVLDRTLEIGGVPYPVVGVMPPGFDFPERAELGLPLPIEDGATRSAHNYAVVARLAPGVSPARAQADMDAVAAGLARDYPDSETGYGANVVPLRQDLLGPTGPVLLLLLGAVAFVLLIAAANVANLLLARALARRGGAAGRPAPWANRRALVRPFVVESVVLALAGGVLGLGLAAGASRFLAGLAPAGVLDPAKLHVDAPVLLFTFLVALAVGGLCRLAPASRAAPP